MRERERDRRAGGESAARGPSRSFHGNFYQIFTIIPSGLDSAVTRRERERAELRVIRRASCKLPGSLLLGPSLPPFIVMAEGKRGDEKFARLFLPLFLSLSLLMHAIQYVQSPAPFVPFFEYTHT